MERSFDHGCVPCCRCTTLWFARKEKGRSDRPRTASRASLCENPAVAAIILIIIINIIMITIISTLFLLLRLFFLLPLSLTISIIYHWSATSCVLTTNNETGLERADFLLFFPPLLAYVVTTIGRVREFNDFVLSFLFLFLHLVSLIPHLRPLQAESSRTHILSPRVYFSFNNLFPSAVDSRFACFF